MKCHLFPVQPAAVALVTKLIEICRSLTFVKFKRKEMFFCPELYRQFVVAKFQPFSAYLLLKNGRNTTCLSLAMIFIALSSSCEKNCLPAKNSPQSWRDSFRPTTVEKERFHTQQRRRSQSETGPHKTNREKVRQTQSAQMSY